jgi:hypothetical protein
MLSSLKRPHAPCRGIRAKPLTTGKHEMIRTMLEDENTRISERGARFWKAAEILESTWFLVEVGDIGAQVATTERWLTTSIQEAVNLNRELSNRSWTRIYICLNAPLSLSNGTLFEEVTSVQLVVEEGLCLFDLANGMSFALPTRKAEDGKIAPKTLKSLYSQKWTKSRGLN